MQYTQLHTELYVSYISMKLEKDKIANLQLTFLKGGYSSQIMTVTMMAVVLWPNCGSLTNQEAMKNGDGEGISTLEHQHSMQ